MQAQVKRHISSGDQFSDLIPPSISRDTVVVGAGKAQLQDTLHLMRKMIKETLEDTKQLSQELKGHSVADTCKHIWNFVYGHIQYKMDAIGIEQVRRPSRTWADRTVGVDCDCYTVFIGSILTNLGIPFSMRVTKYGGKQHFQHVYPIVPVPGGHITIDCVTDSFDHEVPYSEKKDIRISDSRVIKNLSGLSGVDMAAISLDAIEQKRIPLRELIPSTKIRQCVLPKRMHHNATAKASKSGRTVSPFRFDDHQDIKTINRKKELDILKYLIVSGISVAAGYGVLKLLTKNRSQDHLKQPKDRMGR